MTNGRGSQIDVNYNVEHESFNASYSFIQALPKVGTFQFYPLAGLGINVQNGELTSDGSIDSNSNIGYTFPGTFFVIGMYSKINVTDKLWINYNPMYLNSISGSEPYMDNAFGTGYSDILTHEFAISYQLSPRFNARYFANWSEYTDFAKSDQRIEFNYQF